MRKYMSSTPPTMLKRMVSLVSVTSMPLLFIMIMPFALPSVQGEPVSCCLGSVAGACGSSKGTA